MSILTINNLSHTFDGKFLFENANLSINSGEHIGIVGLNGAGKSTFMNILIGKVIQDEGDVRWLKSIKWSYLDQYATIDKNLTVMEYLEGSFKHLFEINEKLENIYKEMETEQDAEQLDKLIARSSQMMDILTKENFFELESDIKKVANGLGVGVFGYQTKISKLSGGQRAKLMLAGLLLSRYDAILLDEPTNFLDIEHISWLTGYINEYKGTVLVISHDEEFLNNVSKFIISVEQRKIRKYTGNYKDYLAASAMNEKQYAEGFEKQQQEIKKLETFIAKNKARAATAGMANSRKKMLDKMEIVEKPHTIYPSVFTFPYYAVYTKEMLVVDKLEIGYSKPLLPPLSFFLSGETKLWIKGTNGIGKSTLIKTLMGKIPALNGKYELSVNAKCLYLEQDIIFYNSNDTAAGYISDCYPKMNTKDIRTQLGKVGIKNELATKPLCKLSGGEQVKVKLCGLMQNDSNLLILDEPTNHLDVMAKESLSKALQEYKGALILITHEKPFADSICNDVFDL